MGIGIHLRGGPPRSGQLFMNFGSGNPGQQARCYAGFEASSTTFTRNCFPTPSKPVRAGRRASHTYLTRSPAGGQRPDAFDRPLPRGVPPLAGGQAVPHSLMIAASYGAADGARAPAWSPNTGSSGHRG